MAKRTKRKQKNSSPKGLIYTIFVVLMLFYIIILPILYLRYPSNNSIIFALDTVQELVLLFIALAWLIFRRQNFKRVISDLGLSKKFFSWKMVGLGVLAFVIVFLFDISLGVISSATGVQINTNAGLLLGSSPAWFYVIVVLVGPLCEEVFFRGLLARGISDTLKPRLGEFKSSWIGTIVSATVFGLAHATYNSTFGVEMIGAFIFGVIAAYIFRKTKSLYPSFIAHALVNLLAVVVYLAAGSST